MSQSKSEYARKQRQQAYHQANLQGQQDKAESAELLNALSEIDDLPITPHDDETIGQFASRVVSTANLSEKEVRSHEWAKEYILILYLADRPTEQGLHSEWRGWTYGDMDAEKEPLDPKRRAELESFMTSSNLALSRSEDAKAMEESTRNVNESIVNEGDSESGSSGWFSRLP